MAISAFRKAGADGVKRLKAAVGDVRFPEGEGGLSPLAT
jgi:hypothetical protein